VLGVRFTFQQKVAGVVRTFERALHDEERLSRTIALLRETGEITPERADRLTEMLATMTATTNYILRNLAVHLGIGASKAILPLPIGAFLRGSWVVGARVTETLRRRPHRASVHSLPVFLIACVPLAGYLAYIVALRRHDPDAAFLYANHLSVLRYDRPLEHVLESKPRVIAAVIRRAVGTAARPAAAPD
jgi:hypothetical protein